MDRSLMILFKGVCTHLTATHEVANAPAFELRARGEKIQHRVFIANSDLIESEINEEYRPDRHVPKLRIHKNHVTDELKAIMTEAPPDAFELELSGYGITFEGLHPAKGAAKHHPDLEPLPSTFFKGGPRAASPDPRLLEGWSRKTGACVDFARGVKFTSGLAEVVAQLWFEAEPSIVLREENEGEGRRYPLKHDTLLEISNHPTTNCGRWDYLLHYFATDLDLRDEVPEWEVPAAAREPVGEVYCTNSTYP